MPGLHGNPEEIRGPDFTEVMYPVIARVAGAVKDLEEKYIITLAYPPMQFPPRSVVFPENVRIRLAIAGANAVMRPLANDAQMRLLEEWSTCMKGDLVLWTYPTVAW